MKIKKFLALGGPLNGQWVDDNGNTLYYRVPISRPVKFTDIADNVFDTATFEEVKYRKHQLCLPEKPLSQGPSETNCKVLYVSENIHQPQAMDLLKDYLVQQFLKMDDFDDDN